MLTESVSTFYRYTCAYFTSPGTIVLESETTELSNFQRELICCINTHTCCYQLSYSRLCLWMRCQFLLVPLPWEVEPRSYATTQVRICCVNAHILIGSLICVFAYTNYATTHFVWSTVHLFRKPYFFEVTPSSAKLA